MSKKTNENPNEKALQERIKKHGETLNQLEKQASKLQTQLQQVVRQGQRVEGAMMELQDQIKSLKEAEKDESKGSGETKD